MPKCLVTGANGFVGRALCQFLSARGYAVHAAVRRDGSVVSGVTSFVVGNLGARTDWQEALAGVECVVHLAARVHQIRDDAAASAQHYFETNTEGTLQLARASASAGVRRFVFVSSIKVNGEGQGFDPTQPAYMERDPPAPADAYAQSKWAAEQGLWQIAAESGLKVTVIRPPLVYGPGVGANFLRLMRWVERGIPLPFGAINNRRSLVYLGNLVDAIATCLEHPAAAGATFLVRDAETLSTPELIRRIAVQFDRRARLFPVPRLGLVGAFTLIGKRAEADRLLGSLVVDDTHLRQVLGWKPPFSIDEGLAATVAAYLAGRAHARP